MAPRAYWKGYLKLSLVSCPITLSPATSSSEKVSFHRISKQTGNRLRQQLIDEESGEPVQREDVGRGYEVSKRQYVEVEDDDLDKIKVESTHTIDIDSFVPRSEIDDRYLNAPYYIAPDGKVGLDAFAVIRDAISDKGMVALGRIVLTNREHPIMIEPWGKGLLATTLHYPYEVRDDKPYFEDIPDMKLPDEMRQLAAHIVESKAGHFDPEKFEDHYETALVQLLRAKQKGKEIEAPEEAPRPAQVINLMDALRASIGEDKARVKKPAARKSAKEKRA